MYKYCNIIQEGKKEENVRNGWNKIGFDERI